jgi:hypothetical protein
VNKRARQLAKSHLVKGQFSNNWYSFTPEELDEFARTLILESAGVANRHWIQHKGCCAHFSIRQHFGIDDWPRHGGEPK